jgi:hypothetical protein
MTLRTGLLSGACLTTLLLAVGGANAWALGARSMQESDRLLALGRPHESALAARVAAEAVVFGSPYPAAGYARLEALARANEATGLTDEAAFDWRAIRSAAVATRPASTGQGKIVLADEGILRVARLPPVAARGATGSAEDAESVVAAAPEAILRAQLAEAR